MTWWLIAYVLVAACLFTALQAQAVPWERRDALAIACTVAICLVWPLAVFGLVLDWMIGNGR